MKTASYASLFKDIVSVRKRFPHKVYLELTHHCNLNCRHCYIPKKHSLTDLQLSDYKEISEALARLGTLHIILTGGEPLSAPFFEDLYLFLKEKGFLVSVLTNGTLLKDKHFELFSRFPPNALEISLYALSQDSFSNYTQTNISYVTVVDNIKKAMDLNVPLYIKTVVTKDNQEQFREIKIFAKSLGLPFRYDAYFHADINGETSWPDRRLSLSEILKIDQASRCEDGHGRERKPPLVQKQRPKDQVVKRFRCGIGVNSFVIDPAGFVHGCLLYRGEKWSVKDTPIDMIFNEYLPGLKKQVRETSVPCDSCDLMNECGFCEGVLWLHRNDLKIIPVYCELLQRRLFLERGLECNMQNQN